MPMRVIVRSALFILISACCANAAPCMYSSSTCPADVIPDRVVNQADLSRVLSNWGPCDESDPCCAGDINLDHVVNLRDITATLAAWGPCPTITPTIGDHSPDSTSDIQASLVQTLHDWSQGDDEPTNEILPAHDVAGVIFFWDQPIPGELVGIRTEWRDNAPDPVGWLTERMDQLHNLGCRTIVWHMPASFRTFGAMGASQWYTLPGGEQRREEIVRRCGAWFIEHPDTSLKVYVGWGIVEDINSLDMSDVRNPDLSSDSDKQSMIDNVRGYLRVIPGRVGIIYDNASSPQKINHYLASRWFMELTGLNTVAAEAVPYATTTNTAGETIARLDHLSMRYTPWVFTDLFAHRLDTEHEWTSANNDITIWIGLSGETSSSDLQRWADSGFQFMSHRDRWIKASALALQISDSDGTP